MPKASRVFRTFEYRQPRPGIYQGGSWRFDHEVERNCRQKWILQAVKSHRVEGCVVKTGRHVLTINFYDVVDALLDISSDRHLEAFMETPYVKSAMLRCFGTADGSNAGVQKAKATVATIVTQVMETYNKSEEAKIRADNKARRLEVTHGIEMETQAYADKEHQLKMRETAIEAEMRPIRETAIELAGKFFRQAMKEHHPDLAKTDAERDVANEKIITLKELSSETFRQIKDIKWRPQPDESQDDDLPW
ncbi:MAG: hypothetical protein NT118_01140 [Lentisphaerae bacterium]|nr:hypothetical protein [Lentisphaerota bacterium]